MALVLLVPLVMPGWAVGPHGRGEQSLETLTLVLELTPEQSKQANEVFKSSEASKRELLGKVREKYNRLNELIRTEAPKESDVQALCHEIAALQEQVLFRDAQTQIAFRKILDARQIEKLNRLEQINSGPPGPPRRPGGWHPPKGQDH
jgi:Spy/CpxP family protein refolding chaperone